MKIEELNQFDEKWNDFAYTSIHSTVYHLYCWRDIFKKCFGYKSFYLKAVDSFQDISAIQPVFLVNSFFNRKLVSIPFRDRGGPVWINENALRAILNQVIDIGRVNRVQNIEIKSIIPIPVDVVNLLSLHEERYWIHSFTRIDFTPDKLWSILGSKTRNMIRQAQREDLSFEEDRNISDPVLEFYNIYLDTQKKLGIPPFPKIFFSMMYDQLKKNANIKIFFVTKMRKPIASSIIYFFKDTATYAYSASLKRSLTARVNDFMMWNIFNWLIQEDYRIFDMGSDSPLQSGLLFFKKKWLAQQESIPFYYYNRGKRSQIYRNDSSLPVYNFYRKLYSRLPGPIFKSFGGIITKYLG